MDIIIKTYLIIGIFVAIYMLRDDYLHYHIIEKKWYLYLSYFALFGILWPFTVTKLIEEMMDKHD